MATPSNQSKTTSTSSLLVWVVLQNELGAVGCGPPALGLDQGRGPCCSRHQQRSMGLECQIPLFVWGPAGNRNIMKDTPTTINGSAMKQSTVNSSAKQTRWATSATLGTTLGLLGQYRLQFSASVRYLARQTLKMYFEYQGNFGCHQVRPNGSVPSCPVLAACSSTLEERDRKESAC